MVRTDGSVRSHTSLPSYLHLVSPMDVSPPPSSAAFKHSASDVELSEEAHDATAPSPSAKGKEKERRASPAPGEHEAGTSKPHLTSDLGEPSAKSPGGVDDAPRAEPAAATTVPFPQDLLTKLIDTLSKVRTM